MIMDKVITYLNPSRWILVVASKESYQVLISHMYMLGKALKGSLWILLESEQCSVRLQLVLKGLCESQCRSRNEILTVFLLVLMNRELQLLVLRKF